MLRNAGLRKYEIESSERKSQHIAGFFFDVVNA